MATSNSSDPERATLSEIALRRLAKWQDEWLFQAQMRGQTDLRSIQSGSPLESWFARDTFNRALNAWAVAHLRAALYADARELAEERDWHAHYRREFQQQRQRAVDAESLARDAVAEIAALRQQLQAERTRAEQAETVCGGVGHPQGTERRCILPKGHGARGDDYHTDGSVRWLGYHGPTIAELDDPPAARDTRLDA